GKTGLQSASLAQRLSQYAPVQLVQCRRVEAVAIGQLLLFLQLVLLHAQQLDELVSLIVGFSIQSADQLTVAQFVESLQRAGGLYSIGKRKNPYRIHKGGQPLDFEIQSMAVLSTAWHDELAEKAHRRTVAQRVTGQQMLEIRGVGNHRQHVLDKAAGGGRDTRYGWQIEENGRCQQIPRGGRADALGKAPVPFAAGQTQLWIARNDVAGAEGKAAFGQCLIDPARQRQQLLTNRLGLPIILRLEQDAIVLIGMQRLFAPRLAAEAQ